MFSFQWIIFLFSLLIIFLGFLFNVCMLFELLIKFFNFSVTFANQCFKLFILQFELLCTFLHIVHFFFKLRLFSLGCSHFLFVLEYHLSMLLLKIRSVNYLFLQIAFLLLFLWLEISSDIFLFLLVICLKFVNNIIVLFSCFSMFVQLSLDLLFAHLILKLLSNQLFNLSIKFSFFIGQCFLLF